MDQAATVEIKTIILISI